MDQKTFQELAFKAVKNRQRSGFVDCQQVRFVFSQTKATRFETMMTTVNEVNRDKTKVPDYLFRNVSLVWLTAELDE